MHTSSKAELPQLQVEEWKEPPAAGIRGPEQVVLMLIEPQQPPVLLRTPPR